MSTVTPRAMVLAAVLLPGPPALAAQDEGAPIDRTVTGVVFDSVAKRPVSGAVLYFLGRRDEFPTGPDGRFRITGVGIRDTLLVVRRIGFVPVRASVPYSASAIVVDLGLLRVRPVATPLDKIAVEVEEVHRYPQLSEFYRRKQSGAAGFFVTREEILRSGVRRTSEVLARAPRIELDCDNAVLGDERCTARSRRGRNIRRVPPPQQAGQGGRRTGAAPVVEDTTELTFGFDRCEMEVWVDGMRSSLKVDEIPLPWVAGIEVYTGLASTPPGFGSGRCGVVAIWTTRVGG